MGSAAAAPFDAAGGDLALLALVVLLPAPTGSRPTPELKRKWRSHAQRVQHQPTNSKSAQLAVASSYGYRLQG